MPSSRKRHGVDADVLQRLARLPRHRRGRGAIKLDHFTKQARQAAANYDFVNGWGAAETPLLLANSPTSTCAFPAT